MNKKVLTIGGIVVLVLLLAGAAFIGGRLLNGQGLPFGSAGGFGPFVSAGGQRTISLDDILPAAELPKTEADANGLFDHRQNNSIYIGTGKVMISVKRDSSGQVQTDSSHDGPTVEVVVTTQTKVYQDVTMLQFDGPPPEGGQIQQVLEEGSLDDIGQDSMITVWGRKTGDRIIADILVYTPPAFMMKR